MPDDLPFLSELAVVVCSLAPVFHLAINGRFDSLLTPAPFVMICDDGAVHNTGGPDSFRFLLTAINVLLFGTGVSPGRSLFNTSKLVSEPKSSDRAAVSSKSDSRFWVC